MKIIELYNKMANGEDLPNKIKYYNTVYEYDDSSRRYRTINDHFLEEEIANDTRYFNLILNDEVEVIEEKKEENKITPETIKALGKAFGNMQKIFEEGYEEGLKGPKKIEKIDIAWKNVFDEQAQQDCVKMILNKINEIIDEINEGKGKEIK